MKAIRAVLFVFLSATNLTFTGIALAQEKTSSQLQADLVGSWMVTVTGDSKLRVLKVMNASQRSEGTISLDAIFGLAGEKENAVNPEVTQTAQGRKLFFTSKSGAIVVAIQQPDGSFVGTYEMKGSTKGVKLAKVAADELVAIGDSAREARAASLFVTPAGDVPLSCAAFSGKWAGNWSQGGVGMAWLSVAEVNAQCIAKIAYLDSDKTPTRFENVQIKDGVLEWLCNKSTAGTCVLKHQGNELWASYSNPSGGSNSAVFKKVR
ncbi:MAG: hypothetical protein Q7U85_03970 [Rhodocyclaceae bacterium]|nr:hypothetical protein [Rhodocyclaceae bacterium]